MSKVGNKLMRLFFFLGRNAVTVDVSFLDSLQPLFGKFLLWLVLIICSYLFFFP